MKNIVKNSIVAVWLAAVLVASTGFSLHTTYCFCMNQYDISLFETTHACKKQTQEDAATANLHPCCKRALALKKAKQCTENADNCAKKQGDCTHKTTKFVKADLEFLEFKKTELPKIAYIAVLNKAITAVFSPKTLSNYAAFPKIADRAPPQYYGRRLLNFIQVYRL